MNPLQVKARTVSIRTNQKERLITIYSKADSMRQKALLERYGNQLARYTHPAVFSYLKGKSCNIAAEVIQKNIPKYRYYLKIDIKSFFPSMQKERAYLTLRCAIGDAGARDILRYVFWDNKGAAEGSPLSPLVSNLYLNDFDRTVAGANGQFYIRYSDDILILTNSSISNTLNFICRQLQKFKLQINEEKTVTGLVKNGIPYLGKIILIDRILLNPKPHVKPVQKSQVKSSYTEDKTKKCYPASHACTWGMRVRGR